jgi:hypothetical protein
MGNRFCIWMAGIGRQSPIRGQQISHVFTGKKIQASLQIPQGARRRLSDPVRENLSGSRCDRLGECRTGRARRAVPRDRRSRRLGRGCASCLTTVVRSVAGARPGRRGQRRRGAMAGSLPKQSFARGGAAVSFVPGPGK